MRWKYILPFCLLFTGPAEAQEGVPVEAPAAIVETGLMKHVLPRFSLKTGIRLSLVSEDGGVVIGETGKAFMQGLGQVWYVRHDDTPEAARFAEWLGSDIGQRTIASFAPDGVAPFGPPPEEASGPAELVFDGDADKGLEISLTHCKRCHAVSPGKRYSDIGSTPSFFVLRTLENWPDRFAAFFALAPHPAFTQITDVTAPFPDNLPPPISPIEMTLEEIDAVLAYVAGLPAADLGEDLQHQ